MWWAARSFFVPTVSGVAVMDAYFSPDWPSALEKLYEWERDRLLTLCKGAAATVVTVTVALTAIGFSTDSRTPPTWLVWAGCAALGVLLAWAGYLLVGLRRLAEEYVAHLAWLRSLP
ncbi:MAG: hypothetical protein JWL64_17 [Frankiales bacterium]|nr:hypothetical protein [Frankiales bacterium]